MARARSRAAERFEAMRRQVPGAGHGGQCSDMAVGDGAFDGDGGLGAAQALALERSVKALDFLLVAQMYIENRRGLHVSVLA